MIGASPLFVFKILLLGGLLRLFRRIKIVVMSDIEYTTQELARAVKSVARNIDFVLGGQRALNPTLQGKDLIVVCVLKGGFIFTADLVRELNIPTRIEFIQAKSYNGHQRGPLYAEMARFDVRDHLVLIVDDIADSGSTLFHLRESFLKHGAYRVYTCAMVTAHPSFVDFYGIYKDNARWLYGYGMDLNERQRGLKEIYSIEREGSDVRSTDVPTSPSTGVTSE